MYGRIFHPTDGSDESAAAAEHAIELATTYGAELHVVHVVETDVTPVSGVPAVFDALEDAGRDAIDAVVERAEGAGVETVEGSIASGSPHRVVLDYVDEHDVDLVVMGTHGRTGFERYVLGSVAGKVVRLCPVPVLTVRTAEEGDA